MNERQQDGVEKDVDGYDNEKLDITVTCHCVAHRPYLQVPLSPLNRTP